MHKDLNVQIISGGGKGEGNDFEKGRHRLDYLRTSKKTIGAPGEWARQRQAGDDEEESGGI